MMNKFVAMNSALAIAALAFGLGAAGCNEADDVINGAGEVFDGARAANLQHRFQEEKCGEPLGLAVIGASKRVIFEFDGRAASRNQQYYSEGDCKGDVAIDVYYKGQYSKGDDVQENVSKIDLTFGTVVVVPRNEEGVKALNAFNLCGISDWAIGQERDVTSASRDAKCPVDGTPQNVFDIYSVQDNVLVFGKGGAEDKDTAEKRATELDRETTYRQL
jgi:hypothetical protein